MGEDGRTASTGFNREKLSEIGVSITTLPTSGTWHRQIGKIFDARLQSIQTGKGIDWGTAEALAFSSLISEGYHVRISGQDVERGTFSHRHAVVHDQTNDHNYIPISTICPKDGFRNFIASNSHLSEFAVLGFEYGYAQANPNTLTIWEA
jgi:2-oxoglutarate dehydrogenase E1 component